MLIHEIDELFRQVLSNKQYNFYNKYLFAEKCPSSIWCWDSNPQNSEREFLRLTTRSELPPNFQLFESIF